MKRAVRYNSFCANFKREVSPCALALRNDGALTFTMHMRSDCPLVEAARRFCEAVLPIFAHLLTESGHQEMIRAQSGICIIGVQRQSDSASASIACCSMKGRGHGFLLFKGIMGELGDFTQEGHEKAGSFVASSSLDCLFVRWRFSPYRQAAIRDGYPEQQVQSQVPSREAALAYLKEHMTQGDAVLVKASHSMELDRIAKGLLN